MGEMAEYFRQFDVHKKNALNLEAFANLCKDLFHNSEGISYKIEDEQLATLFHIFDLNKDGEIDRTEFSFCWNNWIQKIKYPVSALVIVDVQNDFISGSLSLKEAAAREDGFEVVDKVNNLLQNVEFDAVFYSMDWHPKDHISFVNNVHKWHIHETSEIKASEAKILDTVIFEGPPITKQILWPEHCVQGTWGSQLHEKLNVVENALMVYKGTHSTIDSYSAFRDNVKCSETTLPQELKKRNITDVYVCGLAYDCCVGLTAIDSLEYGYRTILIEDCCRSLDLLKRKQMKQKLLSNGAVVINSSQVSAMLDGRDTKVELGCKLACYLKSSCEN